MNFAARQSTANLSPGRGKRRAWGSARRILIQKSAGVSGGAVTAIAAISPKRIEYGVSDHVRFSDASQSNYSGALVPKTPSHRRPFQVWSKRQPNLVKRNFCPIHSGAPATFARISPCPNHRHSGHHRPQAHQWRNSPLRGPCAGISGGVRPGIAGGHEPSRRWLDGARGPC